MSPTPFTPLKEGVKECPPHSLLLVVGTNVCPPYYVSGHSDSILSLTSTQAFSMYIVCLELAHSGSQPFN